MNRANGILIVGAGGLGVPAAISLVRAGVGPLGLVDPGAVELSNLHRQIIYGVADIGRLKVERAARRLKEMNPALEIEGFGVELDASNARRMVSRYAFVIDATDNPAAKFLVNDTCVAAGRPFVYGGVLGMGGQAMTVIPGRTACLRCLFEQPPDAAEAGSCREAGIVGPVAGFIGAIQAREAARFVRGANPELAGSILTYDGAAPARVRVAAINPRAGCACGAYQATRPPDAAERNLEGTR
jgi:molybdopterin-synthase adenylyltransferase